MTNQQLLPSLYEQPSLLKSSSRQEDAWRHVFAPLLAGICSGGAATIVGHPFETLKTRMQVGRLLPENTPLNTAFLRQLYRGLIPPLLTTGAINSFHFTLFETFRRQLQPDAATHGRKYDLSTTFLAGCASGSMISWISCPVSVIKIHQQVASERGLLPCIQQVYHDAGVRGFYRGIITAVPMDASRGMYLTAYELLKVQLAKLGNFFHIGMRNVLESPSSNNVPSILSSSFPFPSALSTTSCTTTVDDVVMEKGWDPESMGIRVAAAGLSGICCWLIIYPMDVVKSRLQSDYRGLKYKGTMDCIRQSFREGGLKVFYRGLVMNVIRAGPVSAATLSTYELVKDMLLKKDANGNYSAAIFVTSCDAKHP